MTSRSVCSGLWHFNTPSYPVRFSPDSEDSRKGMVLSLYMDHHVPRAITMGLRLRGMDVVTAYEDEANQLDDSRLLDRATALKRILFTRDDDLLAEAVCRQRKGGHFYGLVYAHQLRVSIGMCIDDLETIAKASMPEDVIDQVLFLPL